MKRLCNRRVLFGALAIIIAAVLWSLDWTFIRPKFYELPVGVVVFLEHLFWFVVLVPFIIIGRRKIKKLGWKDRSAILRICIFGGLIGTFMITKAFFLAFAWAATFATVILLQKLQPVFALLMARLVLKEKLKRTFYLRAIVAIFAWYILAFGDSGLNFAEIDLLHNVAFFSLLAAFAFGSSTVFGKRIVNHLDFKITAWLRFWITAILSLVLILITKDFSAIGIVSWLQRKYLVLIVFSSGAWALFLYYFWLKRVKASTATILELAWPLSAVALDYIINKNTLTFIQIGATVVLLFAFFMIVKDQKWKKLIFKSIVIRWCGKWKKLGFHTANLKNTDINLPHGVYTCHVTIWQKTQKALMHFWFVKTYHRAISLEIHIPDFSEDLYNQEIEIHVEERLRSIINFAGDKELIMQIEKDLKRL